MDDVPDAVGLHTYGSPVGEQPPRCPTCRGTLTLIGIETTDLSGVLIFAQCETHGGIAPIHVVPGRDVV